MALKRRFEKKEEVPAELANFYVEKDGAWVLTPAVAAELEETKSKIDEFRDNNTKLQKKQQELADQLKKFEGIDPEKIKEITEKARLAEEEGLKKKGDVDELVRRATAEVKRATDEQVKILTAQLEDKNKQLEARNKDLEKVVIEQEIVKAAQERGARAGAIPDIISRAIAGRGEEVVFRLEEGKAVAYRGDAKAFNGKTAEPMTISDWVDELATKATHLFEENRGSGATGSSRSGAGAVKTNPWAKETFNLTMQGEIYKKDPILAARLASQAGKRLTVAQ